MIISIYVSKKKGEKIVPLLNNEYLIEGYHLSMIAGPEQTLFEYHFIVGFDFNGGGNGIAEIALKELRDIIRKKDKSATFIYR